MCAMMNNMIADALFGNKNSITNGSFFSSSNFGDLGLMKNGVYKKMLRAYYEKNPEETKKTTSDQVGALKNTEAERTLSQIKSSSKSLSEAAGAVTKMDLEQSSKEEMYDAVKKMTDGYNAVLDGAKKSEYASISQSLVWMKNDTRAQSTQLSKVGINVSEEGKMTIDKEKFLAANTSELKSLFNGNGSFANRLNQRANGLTNLSANQMSIQTGKTLYSANGVLI